LPTDLPKSLGDDQMNFLDLKTYQSYTILFDFRKTFTSMIGAMLGAFRNDRCECLIMRMDGGF
jgi:hypothetical protein